MAIRGRPPGTPKSPRSGKQANHGPNKKKMSTAEMRAKIHEDLIWVYEQLQDRQWLLKVAQDFPLEFLRQGWARIAPPLPRDNPEITQQTNVNLNLSEIEVARRIAFVMASAADRLGVQPEQPVREIPSNWRLPDPVPEPPVDIEKIKSEELTRNTIDCTIESYPGDSAQQGYKRRNLI